MHDSSTNNRPARVFPSRKLSWKCWRGAFFRVTISPPSCHHVSVTTRLKVWGFYLFLQRFLVWLSSWQPWWQPSPVSPPLPLPPTDSCEEVSVSLCPVFGLKETIVVHSRPTCWYSLCFQVELIIWFPGVWAQSLEAPSAWSLPLPMQ